MTAQPPSQQSDRCGVASFAFPLARCELAVDHDGGHRALGGEIGWHDNFRVRDDHYADETTPQTGKQKP